MELTIKEENVQTTRVVSAEVDDVRYTMSVTEVDSQIESARCSIGVLDEEMNSWVYQGTIIYSNGQITTQQVQLEDSSKYINGFVEIINALKNKD
jgi:hypothetical protein